MFHSVSARFVSTPVPVRPDLFGFDYFLGLDLRFDDFLGLDLRFDDCLGLDLIRFVSFRSVSLTCLSLLPQCAVEPVWYLPEIARRFEVDEVKLRETLFRETNMMFPELVTREDLKVQYFIINSLFYGTMYGHTYSKSIARGELNRKNEYFPVRVGV